MKQSEKGQLVPQGNRPKYTYSDTQRQIQANFMSVKSWSLQVTLTVCALL